MRPILYFWQDWKPQLQNLVINLFFLSGTGTPGQKPTLRRLQKMLGKSQKCKVLNDYSDHRLPPRKLSAYTELAWSTGGSIL